MKKNIRLDYKIFADFFVPFLLERRISQLLALVAVRRPINLDFSNFRLIGGTDNG